MPKVLLIDDEEAIRMICRISLEAGGIDVIEATGGEAGLQAARAELPDLIVLDVMMPGLDGLQVAGELADDPATAAIPIVFLSAYLELRVDGADVAAAYIGKPFDPATLAPLILQVLA